MKIADFFVNIGIKGDDKTKKGLKDTKEGVSDLKSMSLEAKAAIIGAIYALERMMSSSAKTGTGLMNFASITGQSAIELQKWQYAARQVGVANEEVEGSFKGVQDAMTNMLLGKGAPEGMAMLANKVGFDPSKARDTFYVLEQLQKFAQSVPEDVGNAMIKSFGVSDSMMAAMRRNAFKPEVMAKAPVYSQGEINTLNKIDVAWSNIGNKIQIAMGHLTAKHGLGLVNEISGLITQVMKLVDAFTILAEKLQLIKGIGKVFEGWTAIFKGITEIAEGKVKLEDVKSGASDFFKGMYITAKEAVVGPDYEIAPDAAKNSLQKNIAPNINKPVENKNNNQNININQNLNFQHDGKDAKKTGTSTSKAVKDAFRQMSAQAQGS